MIEIIIIFFFIGMLVSAILIYILFRLYHRGDLGDGFVLKRLGNRHVLKKDYKFFDIVPTDGKYRICPTCNGVMKYWEIKNDRNNKLYEKGYQCFDCARNIKERIT